MQVLKGMQVQRIHLRAGFSLGKQLLPTSFPELLITVAFHLWGFNPTQANYNVPWGWTGRCHPQVCWPGLGLQAQGGRTSDPCVDR